MNTPTFADVLPAPYVNDEGVEKIPAFSCSSLIRSCPCRAYVIDMKPTLFDRSFKFLSFLFLKKFLR